MLDAGVIRLRQATTQLAKRGLEVYYRWDRMLELSTSDPDGAFEIAEAVLLAELRTEFPHVPSDVGPFLEYVLKDGGKETRQRARRLVHKLGERGFREFKDLLEEDIAPSIGILAFGSLRDDPGEEIEAVLVERRPVETPFPVEFARYSKSRGGAPTLVPVEDAGATVPAEVLVLKEGVSQTDAQSLLWRREARRADSGEYERPKVPGPNHVLVEERHDVAGVGVVFYTDFARVGKVPDAAPEELARHAIASVGRAESEKDGVTYLIKAQAAGTVTPKTEAYEAEVLHQTGAGTLEEALAKTRSGDNPGIERGRSVADTGPGA
jgi:hypothetical protein